MKSDGVDKDGKKRVVIRKITELPEENEDDLTYTLNDGRRFYFVVYEKFVVRAGTIVVGFARGRIDLGDEVFLTRPDGRVVRTRVLGMESKIADYMMKIQTAEDMPVNLLLGMDPALVDKYSVITSVNPVFQIETDETIENPTVSALLYEKRLFDDEEYFNWMCFALVHGHFITPIQADRRIQERENGTVSIEDCGTVAYCMLPDPKDQKGQVLPIFTDRTELDKWKAVMQDAAVQIAELSFQEVVSVTDRPGCTGFVVNPFSGNQTIISEDMIKAITESEGYQEEFPNSEK